MGSWSLNILSLLLGLIAWILPIINLAKKNKFEHKNWVVLSIISVCACAISIYIQILNNNFLILISDMGALADVYPGLVSVSTWLLIITILLNAITLAVYNKYIRK